MLDVNNIDLLSRYLCDHGFAGDPSQLTITPLSGGVSNTVIKVYSPRGVFVLKQALRKLKVKAEWISDLERIHVEKQVLRFLARVIPGYTPALIFEDDGNYVFMMESAPEQASNWKQLLMKGELKTSVAGMCGQFLGLVHQVTGGSVEARQLFSEKKYFRQLRVEPFFEYLKPMHPALEDVLEQHIEKTWARRDCLVFGDYSPKNILVWEQRIMPIDFEVAHMGDASFDIGFITCHLLLKSLHFPERMDDFHALAAAVLDGYFGARPVDRTVVEAEAVMQLAFLMLARVDGKSPVEYIVEDDEKQRVRRIANRIIQDGLDNYGQVMALVRAETKR